MSDAPDRHLDLTGEVCPYTFVRTQLVLEEMGAGEVLEVTLDHEPATESVPRSAERHGHAVLGLEETEAGARWVLRLRRAPDDGDGGVADDAGGGDGGADGDHQP